MSFIYKGFRINVWVDDDTNHARMLRGESGPERLYVDIDEVSPQGGKPRSARLSVWSIGHLDLEGDDRARLEAAARLWVDAPEKVQRPRPPGPFSEISRAFRDGRHKKVVVGTVRRGRVPEAPGANPEPEDDEPDLPKP